MIPKITLSTFAVLETYKSFYKENGYGARPQDIAGLLGIHPNIARKHTKRLVDFGILLKTKIPQIPYEVTDQEFIVFKQKYNTKKLQKFKTHKLGLAMLAKQDENNGIPINS